MGWCLKKTREIEETRSQDEDEKSTHPSNVRRLHHGEFMRERQERIRKDDTDVPAFLRKMMD